MDEVILEVFRSMASIKKPQRVFMVSLFAVLMVFQGKATFRNMSRYCHMSEKRFGRWYRRDFDFTQFNLILLDQMLPENSNSIAAIDASFISKSGKHTDGLGSYYNGSAGKAQRGLEVSLICIIDLKSNTAFSLDACQTIDQEGKSRVDLYAEQVVNIAPKLKEQGIRHLTSDAYYSKIKFVSPVTDAGIDIVGKLRIDANLKWLNEADYSGFGRPKTFDGKIKFENELTRFDKIGTLDDGVEVYAKTVHSVNFKRKIKVVMLTCIRGDKTGRALLYSTDTSLDAMTLISYYKARFQIEFIFRDAKQYTGLIHCQSRNKKATNIHLNSSLVALNLLKIEDRLKKQTEDETVISIATWKRRKFNQNMMIRLFDELGLSLKDKKVSQVYDDMSDYGAIAA
jgi:hypothetical protein